MKYHILAAVAGLTFFAGQALAEDVQVKLTNQSEYTIDQMFASPADKDEWGDDILGQDKLEGGNFVTVTVTNGSEACIFDIKVVDEDKQEHELKGIDICKNNELTFNK